MTKTIHFQDTAVEEYTPIDVVVEGNEKELNEIPVLWEDWKKSELMDCYGSFRDYVAEFLNHTYLKWWDSLSDMILEARFEYYSEELFGEGEDE